MLYFSVVRSVRYMWCVWWIHIGWRVQVVVFWVLRPPVGLKLGKIVFEPVPVYPLLSSWMFWKQGIHSVELNGRWTQVFFIFHQSGFYLSGKITELTYFYPVALSYVFSHEVYKFHQCTFYYSRLVSGAGNELFQVNVSCPVPKIMFFSISECFSILILLYSKKNPLILHLYYLSDK